MERKKTVEKSQPVKEDNLFKHTGFSGDFPIGSTKNMCSIYFLSGITGIIMSMVNNHKHCPGSLPACLTHTVEEMRCVRKKTCSVQQPTKAAHKVTASMLIKPCPKFNFRHKFSLLIVGPTQSGKTYFVQQILKHNRIVYEEQKSIRIFWYYNQWQECYEDLKTSLGKSIRFERGVPELSENLCEINPRYNNIIILDDLMAEATDSPVVSRLFTQGRHRNASVILLLQNMFPKGEYNTDISRNAQYLALFRSPSDRKQIGIIGERMFDKNRVHFMNAYYKETEKPFGYLLVDNKPDTPADKQILADLFGECYVYHFGVNSTKPTRVETKPVGKYSTATKTTSSRKKPVQTVTWSDVPNDVWLKYILGAPEFLKISEGYVIIEMYNTSRNIQLLDETEQNIVIYQWRADQLFADAEGRGK